MTSPTPLPFPGFPRGSVGEEPTCNSRDTGDAGPIPGSERSPREGHGNSLQYSCLENPVDSGDWRATVHSIAKTELTESKKKKKKTHCPYPMERENYIFKN